MSVTLSRTETTLFRLSRAAALVLILLLGVGIVMSLAQLVRPAPGVEPVTYADVVAALAPVHLDSSGASTGVPTSVPIDATIPANVRQALSGNETVFNSWLDALNADEKRGFVQGMSAVIAEAEAKKQPDIVHVINKYKELYWTRRASTVLEPYAALARKGMLIGQSLVMAGLIGVFILLLVLLAIERHVREATAAWRGGTKPCPFCAEQIAGVASKCPFCGEQLTVKPRIAQ